MSTSSSGWAGEAASQEALALCRGELLDGIEDEWALMAREGHRQRVIGLLEQLAHECDERGETGDAIDWTRREVQRDPFDEAAHRRLISRLDAAGDRAGALRTYRSLAERLRRELGTAASVQTRELIERLRTDSSTGGGVPAVIVAPGLLALIGRERELAELERVWRAVTNGSGAVAVVRGEAGIGKTRLATELRKCVTADGGDAAACAALDLGGSAPLSLWAELIRELLPALPAPPADSGWPEDLTALVSELPAHFARGGTPSTVVAPDLQRTRLFEAVVAMLSFTARERPVLLVFEDVHASDRPSLELAGYVARRVAGLRIMILLTRRELPHSADADRLEEALRSRGLLACELPLQPLAPGAVVALARRAAPLNDADVQRVVKQAEGNALLAVETARALSRGLQDQVAPSLRGSVRATLTPLIREVRKLLELTAIAARGLEPVELGRLGLHDPDESAEAALQTGLLVGSDGRLGFRHALLAIVSSDGPAG